MKRSLPLLVAAAFLLVALAGARSAVPALPTADHATPVRFSDAASIGSLPPLPAGLGATARAGRILGEASVQGRTPSAWLQEARSFGLDAPVRASAPGGADLRASVLALYGAAGVPPTRADLAAVDEAIARLPTAARAPTADLVATVAAAYGAQEGVVAHVTSRLAAGDLRADGVLLHADERDATLARAHDVVNALDAFRAQWSGLGLSLSVPTCLAPVTVTGDCLAYLGSSGNDAYPCNPAPLPDPILIVDPSGDDTYTCGAGAARPVPDNDRPANGLALSVVADLSGTDTFSYTGGPSAVQGAGYLGGLGILVHYSGNDHYAADMTRTSAWGSLLPFNDDGGAQGFGNAGVGILLDGWGDSVYESHIHSPDGECMFGYAQGWGGNGGVGIASDSWGNNTWIGTGDSTAAFGAPSFCWVGVYNHGSSLGGVGILANTGGGKAAFLDYDNSTSTDFYAQGFAGFGGLGLLYDQGADDTFIAESHATNANIDPALNCAFGTGSAGGVGVLWAEGGNDAFLANTTSDKGAVTMVQGAGDVFGAYGLFVHNGGRDDNEAYASTTGAGFTGVFGRGVLDSTYHEWNVAGTFVHTGGETDTYVPLISDPVGGTAENSNEWIAGVDS
jgi:hypothetical protein